VRSELVIGFANAFRGHDAFGRQATRRLVQLAHHESSHVRASFSLGVRGRRNYLESFIDSQQRYLTILRNNVHRFLDLAIPDD
jgi:hypothetical protein